VNVSEVRGMLGIESKNHRILPQYPTKFETFNNDAVPKLLKLDFLVNVSEMRGMLGIENEK